MAVLSSSSSEVEGHGVDFFTRAPKGILAGLFTIEGAKESATTVSHSSHISEDHCQQHYLFILSQALCHEQQISQRS